MLRTGLKVGARCAEDSGEGRLSRGGARPVARTEPGYDYFPQGRPGAPSAAPGPGRALVQRGRPLQSLSAEEDDDPGAPFVPAGRLSAPPPNLPPVFERPVQPRGDQRTWNAPGGEVGQRTAQGAGRPVPAFTAHGATAVRAGGRTLDGLPAQAGPAGAGGMPPHGAPSVGAPPHGAPPVGRRPSGRRPSAGRPGRRRPCGRR